MNEKKIMDFDFKEMNGKRKDTYKKSIIGKVNVGFNDVQEITKISNLVTEIVKEANKLNEKNKLFEKVEGIDHFEVVVERDSAMEIGFWMIDFLEKLHSDGYTQSQAESIFDVSLQEMFQRNIRMEVIDIMEDLFESFV